MQRMPYDEAIDRFGTDRPDLRFGLELVDLGDGARRDRVQGLPVGARVGWLDPRHQRRRAARCRARSLTGFISRAQELGAKGLVWAFREGDGWRSPTAKFLSEAELAELNRLLGAEEGDLLLLVADKRPVDRRGARADAARPRRALRPDRRGRRTASSGSSTSRCWTTTRSRSAATPLHHPFTAPAGGLRPGRSRRSARAQAYDVVWNGQELGGGSIRIHRAAVQEQVFAALGIDERDGGGALRLPARGAALRRAAARRHRLRARPHRPAPRRGRDDPRRDRLPEDRLRLRPPDRRARRRSTSCSCARSASRSTNGGKAGH